MGDDWRLITATLSDVEQISYIQDKFLPVCGSQYKTSDPHITIIPPFVVPDEEHYSQIQSMVNDWDLVGSRITVHGAGIWPNIDNPRVILLDTSIDSFEIYQKEIVEFIKTVGGELWYDPSPSHITLCKCDSAYDLEAYRKNSIRSQVSNMRESWETQITGVEIETTK